jgi:ribosomal protein S6--L-glutamate ligase
MDITSDRSVVRYKGQALPQYDAIIPRFGTSIYFYGSAIMRQFEMTRAFSVDESVVISCSRDKLRSMQLLSRKCIGLSRKGFANRPDNIKDLIKNVGGAPCVIKLLEGTQVLEWYWLKKISQQRLLLSLYGVECRYFNSSIYQRSRWC